MKNKRTHNRIVVARDVSPLGRREQNKRDKLERILAAARRLFTQKGFDATRISDIAHRAHVATGTVFMYAEDKRDLVFLVINDEFEAVTDRAFATIDPGARLLDQLTDLFRHYYAFYHANQSLARILLREIFFFSVGRQAQRTLANVQSVVTRLTALIAAAQRRRELRSTESPAEVARLFYSIYQIEVRRWVGAERWDIDEGVATLQNILALAFRGCEVRR